VPLPGSTVRIADDGEVLAKGVGVFAGYRNADDDRDAFVDGFFRTGDLGRLDERGRLVLEGRVKDVVTTSGGKTVAPARWEAAIEEHPVISSGGDRGGGAAVSDRTHRARPGCGHRRTRQRRGAG
jgi:long-chain acyl-CoA synthetase